ncbi:MAG: TRAP transporter large permease subunit [Elusimicrobia bacterium]|nr:TRAP transporter large permease subunit [Elusimicrobiota bacterium]
MAIALFLALTLIGTPLFAIVGAIALQLFHGAEISPAAVIVEMQRLASLPALIAVPLFTFAGYMLAESKAPQRLLALVQALFGSLQGGVAIAGLVACALFTAFTGASGVTIVALGGLIYPLLRSQGYPERFTLGLITTTGSLGLLFPPSLPIILYALVGKVSIDKLFGSCALPGAILIAILSVYAVIVARRHRVPTIPFSARGLAAAARAAAWEIPLPFLIIGGIYSGAFTATEAASVMCVYVLVVEAFVYRDIALKDLPGVMVRSQILVGAILMMLGCALGLTNYLIDAEIPAKLFDLVSSRFHAPWQFLILLNVFLLVVNMIEIFSAIVIVVPIIVPVALRYGIDPVHLGTLFLLNLEIGYMTPPLGLNIFLSSRRFDKPLGLLYGSTLPFWLVLLAALALVTYIPALSLWLPTTLNLP